MYFYIGNSSNKSALKVTDQRSNRGHLFHEQIFTSFLILEGSPLNFDAHLERLKNSIRYLFSPSPQLVEEFESLLLKKVMEAINSHPFSQFYRGRIDVFPISKSDKIYEINCSIL